MNYCNKKGVVLTATALLMLYCFYLNFIRRYNAAPRSGPASPSMQSVGKNCTEETNVRNELPKCVIDHIQTFVFFLGIGRSGHSIIGSILDSHPHMVVAHEYNLFYHIAHGNIKPTKLNICNALWRNSRESLMDQRHLRPGDVKGLRAKSTTGKGYTLFIDNLYQGKYVDYIDVIGDKKAHGTTLLLDDEPVKWFEIFNGLKSLVATIKAIHAIRNPYDNIATLVMYTFRNDLNFGNAKKHNETFQVDAKVITGVIETYFKRHQAAVEVKRSLNLDVIEIHNKHLISDPRGILLKLCKFLEVTCSNSYLDICSKKIFKTESRTRHMIMWNDKHLKMIQQNIDKYNNLKGYDFDSL